MAAALPWAWFLVRDRSVVFEVVAILLPALVLAGVAALALVAVLTRLRWAALAAASWLVFLAVVVVAPWVPRATAEPRDPLTIAVGNAFVDNPDPAAAVDALLAVDADVLVVPEATPAVHRALAGRYRHAVRHVQGEGIGVYARVPVRDLGRVEGLLDRSRQLRLEVDGPGAPFVLWAVHLSRPWFRTNGSDLRPGGHAEKLDAFRDRWEAETLPVVVAGDLNLTDRGRGYRRALDGRRDAMRGIWGGPTSLKLPVRPLLLRIDHILVPDGWCADDQRRFDIAGSDHRGVAATVGPCATGR